MSDTTSYQRGISDYLHIPRSTLRNYPAVAARLKQVAEGVEGMFLMSVHDAKRMPIVVADHALLAVNFAP